MYHHMTIVHFIYVKQKLINFEQYNFMKNSQLKLNGVITRVLCNR